MHQGFFTPGVHAPWPRANNTTGATGSRHVVPDRATQGIPAAMANRRRSVQHLSGRSLSTRIRAFIAARRTSVAKGSGKQKTSSAASPACSGDTRQRLPQQLLTRRTPAATTTTLSRPAPRTTLAATLLASRCLLRARAPRCTRYLPASSTHSEPGLPINPGSQPACSRPQSPGLPISSGSQPACSQPRFQVRHNSVGI